MWTLWICDKSRKESPLRDGNILLIKEKHGFSLMEVIAAMSIIAIALTAVLSSQSQSVSLAGEAKFSTTAALLAQSKLAEIETMEQRDLRSDSIQ